MRTDQEERYLNGIINQIEIQKAVYEAVILIAVIAGGFALARQYPDAPLYSAGIAAVAAFVSYRTHASRIKKLQKFLEKHIAQLDSGDHL